MDENGNRKTKERKRLKPLAKDLQSNPVLQSLLLCHKNTNLFLYIGKHQLRIYEIKPPSIMTATLTGGKLLSFFILLACIKKAPGSAHPLSRISGVRGLLSSARSQEHNRIANIRTISYTTKSTTKKHRPGALHPRAVSFQTALRPLVSGTSRRRYAGAPHTPRNSEHPVRALAQLPPYYG